MKKKLSRYSTLLFPNASFLTGAGSAFNVCGNYYIFNYSKSETEADNKALSADWLAIGSDLNDSIEAEKTESNLLELINE